MSRRLGAVLGLAIVAYAAAPAAAADGFRYPKCRTAQQCGLLRSETFVATLSGKQTTWWTYRDPGPAPFVQKYDEVCAPAPSTTTGQGKQVITFASARPFRFVWLYTIGNHTFVADGRRPVPATVTVAREGFLRKHEPASCGRPDITSEPIYDCGVRKPRWYLAFRFARPRAIAFDPAYRDEARYAACPIYPDTGVEATGRLRPSRWGIDLLAHGRCQRRSIVWKTSTLTSEATDESGVENGPRWRSRTEQTWTLRLRRVGCGRA